MSTMYDLEKEVRKEVRDRIEDLLNSRYPSDILNEIADNNVPIYNRDRVELLLDEMTQVYMSLSEVIEGVTDIFQIIGVSIYEKLSQTAREEFENIRYDYEVCDECGDYFDTTGDNWDEEYNMCLDCSAVKREEEAEEEDEDDWDEDDYGDEEEGEEDNW